MELLKASKACNVRQSSSIYTDR